MQQLQLGLFVLSGGWEEKLMQWWFGCVFGFGFGFSIAPIVFSFVVFDGLFQVNRRFLNEKRIFYDSKRYMFVERRAGPRATRSKRISLPALGSRCLCCLFVCFHGDVDRG